MYIDVLAVTAEVSQHVRSGNMSVVVVSDDILIQAKSPQDSQVMIYISTN